MAGVTKTGLFYYIDENTKHVYVEQKADPGTFAVLYGSPVEAVAWKADGKQVALLCKSDAATEVGVHQNKTTHTPSSEAKSVIRVFGVAGKECLLGDLLDELIIPEATELVWMTDVDYIVASKPQTFSTVVSVKGGKLKFSLRDDGVLPFAVKQTLALLNAEKQSVTFWDMQKNESVEVFNLPNRKARKGTTRTVSSTCSSGNFAFLMNDDATVHSACITKNAIAHLTPMLAHFSPFCRRPRKDEEVYAFEGSYRVMAHALPSNQVLVGVMGSPDIYKFEYHKQETALKPLEKLHIPHEEVLLALGADRYLALVRRDGQRTVMVRPLALGPLPSQERAKEKERRMEARAKEAGEATTATAATATTATPKKESTPAKKEKEVSEVKPKAAAAPPKEKKTTTEAATPAAAEVKKEEEKSGNGRVGMLVAGVAVAAVAGIVFLKVRQS